MRYIRPHWGSYRLKIILICLASASAVYGQTDPTEMRYHLASTRSPDGISIDPLLGSLPGRTLLFKFPVVWISADGLWAGGRSTVDIFNPKPDCFFAEHIRSHEFRSYCGLIEHAEIFSFSDDLRYLVAEGTARGQPGAEAEAGVFLFDLKDRATVPITTWPGSVERYISQPSWTHDGRVICFAMSSRMMMYDRVNRSLVDIGPGDFPALSPDGRYLCFRSLSGVMVVRDLQKARDVVLGDSIVMAPAWSPSARSLTYARVYRDPIGNNAEIVQYDVQSEQQKSLGAIYTLGGRHWWISSER